MSDYEKDIQQIADYYGFENQSNKMMEKCAELIQAIAKLKCVGDINILEDIIKKIANVQIMIDRLIYLLDCEEQMKKEMECKVKRQLERIPEE